MHRYFELLKLFPRASRLPFLVGSLMPVGLGTLLAYGEQGLFSPLRFTLALLCVAGTHLSVNLFNDYFDYIYDVDTSHPPRPLSGGSQVIQEGLETLAEVRGQALVMIAVALIAALFLAVLAGPIVFLLAMLGGLLGVFYSGRPLLLSWRSVGELVTGLCFGPLVVGTAYYVQAGFISITSLTLSLVPGGLIAALLFVNQYPDYADDCRAGKRTLVVRLGPRRARPFLYLLLGISFSPLLFWNLPLVSLPAAYLSLGGIFPAALAVFFLAKQTKTGEGNKPGKLMLFTYTLTLSLLLVSIYVGTITGRS